MIRGMRFKIPNLYDSYLSKILSGFNLKKYIWEVSEDDVIIDADRYLFDSDVINGHELEKLIFQPSYYIMFLNLKAFPIDNDLQTIKTYNDFKKSNCKIIILITDSIFVDVYAKNIGDIETIKLNAQRNNFTDIEYITDENDKRTDFCAI